MTDPNVPVPPTLGEFLAEIHRDAQRLRGDVSAAELARRKATMVMFGLLCVLTVCMIAVLIVAGQNNTIASQTRETNARIADCTTATGTCYRQGAARTGSAIAAILRAQIALGECSRLYPGESGPDFDNKLRDCVYQRIATDPGPPTVTPSVSPSPSR
ncbi:MAG TPA: hypothetical protein VE326_11435 [Candidatus Binatia bacterium]|nr:hypothetical protein [Candidatus Binatia bacterium]